MADSAARPSAPFRVFAVVGNLVTETDRLPTSLPTGGYFWIACARDTFADRLAEVQTALHGLAGAALLDLHVSDLLNNQLPSHYDYTSLYDLLVFRRLASGSAGSGPDHQGQPPNQVPRRAGPPALRRIDTSPVGFAVFDHVLLTVHPADCAVREAYAARLLGASAEARGNGSGTPDPRSTGARGIPASPPDLMLRIVNQMVDGYLELRRDLTRQLDHWQAELLHPATRFRNWAALLEARQSLHQLDEICEDQRSAMRNWLDALAGWPDAETPAGRRELELIRVRSRDVLEHIERVVHHVRRLEQSAETAIQMHFSAQGNRTNDIMRTLTALTAIFLPLNLIAGIFGMNFEFIPLLHRQSGFWWAMGAMAAIATGLGVVFWRKRYLARSGR
jgi:Mg2+ and Co2+ transporter CorA